MHGLMTELASRHSVSVLSLQSVPDERALAATREYCEEVVVVPAPGLSLPSMGKRLLQARSLLSLGSFEALSHAAKGFSTELRRLLATRRYDAVTFEFAQMAPYRTALGGKKVERGPVFVLDEHNIEYEILRRTASGRASLPRRAYNALNWRKLRSEEQQAWRSFDGIAVTSGHDQALLLRDLPETRTAVVPNGVDLDEFRPRTGAPPPEPNTILFFGAINYFPNTDAVKFFIDEVLPLVLVRCPGAKLRVVGHTPPQLLSLAGPNVEMAGFVEDIRVAIERAAVVIAPLRVGGGTRLKIVEAMAMGKAIVSTRQGAEGLDLTHGRDVLLADDAASFAEQVLRALRDPGLSGELGKAARSLAESRYGWRAAVQRLERFYDELRGSR